jgi:transcriptional regulator with GAF, ATPase, and Fis domain
MTEISPDKDSPFRTVLLEVWQEACRHIEIPESCGTIARLLGQHLPLEYLLVRRLDVAHSSLDTVAIGQPVPGPFHATPKRQLTPAKLERLRQWGAANEVSHGRARQRSGDLAVLVPEEVEGDVLVGPLIGPEGLAGALILVAPYLKSYRSEHSDMVEALLEPFAVALENDRRLHELAALREAAEADRQSLLSRLGRQDVQETVVGADSGLRHVMERVALVAQSDVPVLILGETGTGKEVVSRAIHARSTRSHGPFIRVNCGAIPAELIDSQLFGHEKGSFTGASDTRKGWFERADGGTLFLDEIGELPLPAQVRLLRVLQDGFVERVGGQQPIRVDVRIVAATHRNLAAMVTSGAFREDLWYRINVFPILLPRLRERLEDIPALARHFAQRAANRFGLAYVEPTVADLDQLCDYPWPGNIRELGAVIDRAAILGNGKRLEVAMALGFGGSLAANPQTAARAATASGIEIGVSTTAAVLANPQRSSGSSTAGLPPFVTGMADPNVRDPKVAEPTIDESDIGEPKMSESAGAMGTLGLSDDSPHTRLLTLDEAMKAHIQRALIATRGRIEGRTGAAAILGINPHTLRARMRKLGLEWTRFRE